MLQKRYQRRLIPLAFIALMLENKLQYHGIAERDKSANDASISCENFAKFGPITSELTVLICERQVRHSQKMAPELDSVLRRLQMDLYLIFQFVKGRCHGNQIILP